MTFTYYVNTVTRCLVHQKYNLWEVVQVMDQHCKQIHSAYYSEFIVLTA